MKDKWKAKDWYKVVAPDMFNRVQIGETLTDEPEKLIGRKTVVTLHDLTGDMSKMHIKLYFQVYGVKGNEALTRLIGHDFTSDYVIRLTRRRKSKTEGVFDVETKDGYKVRVKPLAIADRRIQSSQQYLIRNMLGETVKAYAEDNTFSELMKGLIDGTVSTQAFHKCKKIYPAKRIEVRKSKVLEMPAIKEVIRDEPEEGEEIVEEEPTPEEEAIVEATKDQVIETFTSLKGIGPMKAEAIYAAGFDSIEALQEASVEDLAEVDGFSPTLAMKLKEQL